MLKLVKTLGSIIKGKKTIKNEFFKLNFVKRLLGSYSQYCEDFILSLLLKNTQNGFYIDIGANHPTKFSNTQYFYQRGFRGINIEANPRLIDAFKMQRPEDINLNVGIAKESSDMGFYILDADELGTFNKESATQSLELHGSKIIGQIKVKTEPLSRIIEQYAPDKKIDFMSIDTEGYDLEVLKSNDWKRYRPEFVLVETNQDCKNILRFMDENNYKVVYNNDTNHIFKDNEAV